VRLGLISQENETRFYFGVAETQKTKTSGQLESLWSSRSGVEEQRLAEPFNFRLVRVTEDANIKLRTIQKGSPVFCEPPAFIHHMPESSADSKECYHSFRWEPTLFIPIDVAGDGGDRSDPLQLFDHGPITYVPGVENVIDPFKMSSNRRIE
jgi:hypothetical protein